VKPEPECGICLMHWVYGRVLPHADEKDGVGIAKTLLAVLMKEVNPEANVGTLCNATVTSVFHTPSRAADHFEALKRESNENAKALLSKAREYVEAGRTTRDRFERACFLAAASNVAPLNSPSGAYTFQEIRKIIDEGGSKPIFAGNVYAAVKEAKQILYVTDNAGEIGFDSLVIDAIRQMGSKITLVVKEKTFFEDATLNEARFFGLDKVVDGLATAEGFFAPHALPRGLREILEQCDLIISKGTGSYEALRGETGEKPAIFMLKVKCGPIARQTGAREGEVVVKLEAPGTAGS
jgi:damage-control phosphatase, subfamily I